jgi:hypothetical protein
VASRPDFGDRLLSGWTCAAPSALVPVARGRGQAPARLDDHHLAAIHPTTSGRVGYLRASVLRYFRFPPHSAFMPAADADALRDLAKACRRGDPPDADYRVLQFYPNLIVIVPEPFRLFGQRFAATLFQSLQPLGSTEPSRGRRVRVTPHGEKAA